MALEPHKFIQNRADFFQSIDRAIADTKRLRGTPPWAPLESILRQLEAMKQWTANGRTPTKDERRSIQIWRTVSRELEPAANDELYDYTQLLTELTFYFKLWWDDAEWAAMDTKDPRIRFPDD